MKRQLLGYEIEINYLNEFFNRPQRKPGKFRTFVIKHQDLIGLTWGYFGVLLISYLMI